MEDKIKIYKYLVIFLWVFSITGVIYHYTRSEKCSENILGCYNAASLKKSNFKTVSESFSDIELIKNPKKEILDVR